MIMENLTESTILVVDDAPENIKILSDILIDYKKIIALNGEKALALALSKKPDLILLDIMMPGIDGFEVCRRLKADDTTKDIPIIFITGKSEVADETRGLELGAVDFIPKPISAPVVLARVRNHLELSLSKRTLAQQKDELELHNKFMTDSINYAQKIQTAILPGRNQLREHFPESFLIFNPKDIVSGDFYWVGQVGNKKIVAVVDCTGHGVPGAFMSMIGNTLINEIVLTKKIVSPAEILTLLDAGIIDELNKDVNEGSLDGMDAGFCVFDYDSNSIQFASAYRPLFYVRDGVMIELQGNKKSIGDNRKKIEYTNQAIPWEAGTTFYLMSDGFIDQNDAENIKFGSKRVKALLQEISNLPMQAQHEKLYSAFLAHKQNETQRDDVTVLAVKI